jgi:hypothetical protein
MKVAERYDFDLFIDEKDAKLSPINYSFIIQSSIFEPFPSLKLNLSDSAGLMQEYLLDVNGMPIKLKYKYAEGKIEKESSFSIMGSTLQATNGNSIDGKNAINAIHPMYFNQETKSKFHSNRISEIVRTAMGDYGFSKLDINDTGNDDDWYQTSETDMEFVYRKLLPFAFSNNSHDSPFFCFIDLENIFHFRNYSSMFNTSSNIKLHTNNPSGKIFNPGYVLDIKKMRTDSSLIKEDIHRRFNYIDEDGAPQVEDDYIYDYPSDSKRIPHRNFEKITSHKFWYVATETVGQEDNKKGIQVNSMKNSLGLEKYILTMYYNVDVQPGKVLDLQIFPTIDQTNAYPNLSGKYLIEKVYHSWNCNNSMFLTMIVVSRKSIEVSATNEYLVLSRLLKK